MSEIIENCSQIDAQNALKSSLGGTLGFNLSSSGTGSRKMDTRYWNGNEKMDTGSWKMETGSHQMVPPGRVPGGPGTRILDAPPACPRSPGGALFKYIRSGPEGARGVVDG